jgi:chemotaxis protein MotB
MAGGAWKVAYADFVTAMMALFMVLWISAQDQKILVATSRYFQNPFSSPMRANSGVMPFNSNKSTQSQGQDSGTEKEADRSKQIEMTFLNSVAADFHRLLHVEENLQEKPVDIQVTSDGLRITLFDRARQRMFVGDTADFTEWGEFVVQSLAWTIDRHALRVTIDGHTRPGIERPDGYTGWELSVERANAARRRLVHYAVPNTLIDRVTGYAETKPIEGQPRESEANQRITLSLSLSAKPKFKDGKMVEKNKPLAAVAPAEAAPPSLQP